MNAFRDGESFTFRVSWGLFRHAGEINISAKTETQEGLPQLRVTTLIETKAVARAIYPYENRAESVIDAKTGLLLAATENGQEGKKSSKSMIVFDYAKRIASFRDYVRPERSKDLPIPEGDPMDLISSLVQTRVWNLKPGDAIPVLVHFYDEFYELVIHADHIEKITTPLGTFDALVLIPKMEKEPKGMFKRGGEVKIWISQDDQHLPVQMLVHLKFGSVMAVLSKYQAPTAK